MAAVAVAAEAEAEVALAVPVGAGERGGLPAAARTCEAMAV